MRSPPALCLLHALLLSARAGCQRCWVTRVPTSFEPAQLHKHHQAVAHGVPEKCLGPLASLLSLLTQRVCRRPSYSLWILLGHASQRLLFSVSLPPL